jgi:hypothetical protein
MLLLVSCSQNVQPPSLSDHESYHLGQAQAKLDVSSGNINFKLFGEPPLAEYYALEESLKNQYSVNCIWVAGCIVDEGQPENCYGYNNIVMKHLLKTHPNILSSLSTSSNLSIDNILGQLAVDDKAL